jgi:hypothetical protein
MYSAASMGSIPNERPAAQQQQVGMMSTLMASVGLAPQATSNAMMPSASFASTVDQNSLGMQHPGKQSNFPRAGSMASTIPEDRVGFMDSLMGSMAVSRPGQQYSAPPTMHNGLVPTQSFCQMSEHSAAGGYARAPASRGNSQEWQGTGVMASIMGMGNMLGSRSGSFAPSMVLEENRSPNRTPMSSIMGSVKGSAHPHMVTMVAENAPAANPMSSLMSTFIQAPVGLSAAQMHGGGRDGR